MKVLLSLIFFGFLANEAFSKTLENCNEAAYALGYVKENAFSLTINTNIADKETQEIVWTMLTAPYFKITKLPPNYRLGAYLPPNKYSTFEVKITKVPESRDYYWWISDASMSIEEMIRYDGVTAGCVYQY